MPFIHTVKIFRILQNLRVRHRHLLINRVKGISGPFYTQLQALYVETSVNQCNKIGTNRAIGTIETIRDRAHKSSTHPHVNTPSTRVFIIRIDSKETPGEAAIGSNYITNPQGTLCQTVTSNVGHNLHPNRLLSSYSKDLH
jgi:hypothetical protein